MAYELFRPSLGLLSLVFTVFLLGSLVQIQTVGVGVLIEVKSAYIRMKTLIINCQGQPHCEKTVAASAGSVGVSGICSL